MDFVTENQSPAIDFSMIAAMDAEESAKTSKPYGQNCSRVSLPENRRMFVRPCLTECRTKFTGLLFTNY